MLMRHGSNLSKRRQQMEVIAAALLVVLLYVAFALFGIGCPIKYITGISCAGCGMTRAWEALLHLDICGAFKFHPLWWSLIPAFVIFIFRGRLHKKTLSILLFIFIASFVIVYLYRMVAGGQDIVVFEPENGLIWRALCRAGVF